MHNIYS